jgi:WD40 repeat protein
MSFHGSTASVSGACLVTATAHKQMRLYDTRASTRPSLSVEIGDYCLTRVCTSADSLSVYVADVTGELFEYDLRTLRRIHTLASSAGSVRGLSLSASGGLLMSVSLDRFCRVFSTASHKLVSERYMNNRLNAGLVLWEEEVSGGKGRAHGRGQNAAGKRRRVEEKEDSESEEGSQEDRVRDLVLSDEEEGSEDGDEDDDEGGYSGDDN